MAVTVYYLYPSVGSAATTTNIPTSKQMNGNPGANTVIATVLPSANADASAIITHMMGLTTAQLSQGLPLISVEVLDNLGQLSNWSIVSQNPNYSVLAKNNTSQGADTVPQIQVNVQRPHTITL